MTPVMAQLRAVIAIALVDVLEHGFARGRARFMHALGHPPVEVPPPNILGMPPEQQREAWLEQLDGGLPRLMQELEQQAPGLAHDAIALLTFTRLDKDGPTVRIEARQYGRTYFRGAMSLRVAADNSGMELGPFKLLEIAPELRPAAAGNA